jgi:hypothetical protein
VHGPHKYISTTRVEDKYSILRKDYAKSLDSCKGTLFTILSITPILVTMFYGKTVRTAVTCTVTPRVMPR